MPRKRKPKIDKIFQDNGNGYIVEKIQKPSMAQLTKIKSEPKIKKEKTKKQTKKKKEKIVVATEKTVTSKDFKNYTLIICEKPQAAMKIAYALADTTPSKKNWFGVPYYELEHNNKQLVIASTVGHLYNLRQKKESSDWPIFNIEWQATQIGYAKKYIQALKHLTKNAASFIIACDYDIEGELIGFNVLRFICNQNDALRMKFSTLTKHDLINSFKNIMLHIDFGQAYAGETRHFLDWFYGINLSRALMEATKKAGSFKILSIGRVQGPALAFIVAREKEIRAFKPVRYWRVFLLVTNSHELEVIYPENIFDKKKAEEFLRLKGKIGKAETKKENKELRPFPPFDLTSLQMEAYKFFGFSPSMTLAIAQKLYLQGLISYPRTSSQKLPPSIGLKKIIEKLTKVYKETKLISRSKPVEGKKTDPAHPAIFPTGEQGKMNAVEKQIYDLIVRRFIACFVANAKLELKKIKVNVEGKDFFAEGKKILEHGWLQVYKAQVQEKELEDFNGKVIVKNLRLEEKQTEPPKRYTAASLISELEKRNLGTKATRADIIDTLYKRNYIIGRAIEATELGMKVVSSLEKNCPFILDEQLTRDLEEEIQKMQEKKNKQEIRKEEIRILEKSKQILKKISESFKKHELEIGNELVKAYNNFKLQLKEQNTLHVCPICKKGKLIMIRSKTSKRFCACDNQNCKKTFPLPAQGLIKSVGKQCPKCGMPLFSLIKKKRKPWEFCMNPECWEKTKS